MGAICIAVDPRGAVYALGDKCPPVNQPLSFGKVDDDGTISDPVLGTKFSLRTGEVVSWCPTGLGKLLGGLFDPVGVPTYPVKAKGKTVEVQVDVNYKANFEADYWSGIFNGAKVEDGEERIDVVGGGRGVVWLHDAHEDQALRLVDLVALYRVVVENTAVHPVGIAVGGAQVGDFDLLDDIHEGGVKRIGIAGSDGVLCSEECCLAVDFFAKVARARLGGTNWGPAGDSTVIGSPGGVDVLLGGFRVAVVSERGRSGLQEVDRVAHPEVVAAGLLDILNTWAVGGPLPQTSAIETLIDQADEELGVVVVLDKGLPVGGVREASSGQRLEGDAGEGAGLPDGARRGPIDRLKVHRLKVSSDIL